MCRRNGWIVRRVRSDHACSRGWAGQHQRRSGSGWKDINLIALTKGALRQTSRFCRE